MALAEQHLQLDADAKPADEDIDDFVAIDQLMKTGIAQGDIKKLRDAGICTATGILMNTRKQLQSVKGLSDAKVEKIIEAARSLVPGATWLSAADVAQARLRDIVQIGTGADALNELLGGGIETKAITEIYGEYRTGKSMLCHTLAVITQLPVELKGAAGKVAFIDTEGNFRPLLIENIAKRFNLDHNAVLNNVEHCATLVASCGAQIVYARPYTHEQQMEFLISIAALMAEEPFKLLIIDSLMAHLRTDFTGRGELADRQQKLGSMMAKLKKLAEEYNIAVVITNHVMSDPGAGAMFVADPKKPIGGHVLAHASTTRLSLRKGKGDQRCCKVMQSPNLPEAEASYQLSGQGVIDYKD